MSKPIQTIITTLVVGAIVANVTILWSLSERLTRIETKIEYIINK